MKDFLDKGHIKKNQNPLTAKVTKDYRKGRKEFKTIQLALRTLR